MKIIKYLFFVFWIICYSSCKMQNNTVDEIALKDCVNSGLSKDIQLRNGKSPSDFYNLITQIEYEFISEKFISNNQKIEYQLFLENIINSNDKIKVKKLHEKLLNLSQSVGFDYNLYSVIQSILIKCPYEIFFKNDKTNHEFIKNQLIITNKLEATGYNDLKLLKKLVDNIDDNSFNKIVYRAPVILLAMINIDLIFNPQIPMEKFEVNGKTYFRPKNEIEKK